jgi:hypothetical protein
VQKFQFDEFFGTGSGMKINGKNHYSMEAVGINVFATLKRNNIPFEVKPKKIINLVCLMLFKKNLEDYFN